MKKNTNEYVQEKFGDKKQGPQGEKDQSTSKSKQQEQGTVVSDSQVIVGWVVSRNMTLFM